MTDDQVQKNLKGMDDLDFTGWNNADWNGVLPTTTPMTCLWTGRARNRPGAFRLTSTQ